MPAMHVCPTTLSSACLVVVKMETKEDKTIILTPFEQKFAIRYYGYGWSFQEITAHILHSRNDLIERDMLREVGICISKRFNKQMYPVEFYGDVEE